MLATCITCMMVVAMQTKNQMMKVWMVRASTASAKRWSRLERIHKSPKRPYPTPERPTPPSLKPNSSAPEVLKKEEHPVRSPASRRGQPTTTTRRLFFGLAIPQPSLHTRDLKLPHIDLELELVLKWVLGAAYARQIPFHLVDQRLHSL